MLRVRGLQLQLGSGRSLFGGLDLDVGSEELLCILGPSGCGKSTLLRWIAGLIESNLSQNLKTVSSGTIEWAEQKKPQLGFVFQDAELLPWRTTLQNVLLPMELLRKKDHTSEARRLLQEVGLGPYENLKPNQLSGGMKMRTSVARALICNPKLLLLDEPFAALDEPTRHRMQDLLLKVQNKSRSAILVTHSIEEAVYLGHRIILMDGNGRIVRNEFNRSPEIRAPQDRYQTDFMRKLSYWAEAVKLSWSST